MRNPLSLHSGLGSLLFLSLVPVALSLPTGPNYGWSPYGSQNHGFQNHDFQNHGFQNHDFQNHGFQNHDFQNHDFQNHDFQNHGFQNHGFQNHDFQNHDFQNHNLYQWPPSNLQSVVTQQGPNVPQHGLPQQHLSSFGNAPQPAQIPPKFSSTSRILPDEEWDRFFLDSARRDLGRGKSAIPPSLPSSHAGSYPSSSEARGFGRVSNEGASSSGRAHSINRHHPIEDAGVFNRINQEKFEGKLKKVNFIALDKVTQDGIKRPLRSFPRNVYEIIEPGQHELQHKGVAINRVWMTKTKGNAKWKIKHPGVFAEIDPAGMTFFNFWGTPGILKRGSGMDIFNYGMGYLDPNLDKGWSNQLMVKLTNGVRTAADFH
ncbi:hypothetical protein NDA17_004946 [Ustilago hordei]|nr:hypothetical protein NDA17_004946 [Ustilago hordei]